MFTLRYFDVSGFLAVCFPSLGEANRQNVKFAKMALNHLKVTLKPLRRIVLNFAKSCILSC